MRAPLQLYVRAPLQLYVRADKWKNRGPASWYCHGVKLERDMGGGFDRKPGGGNLVNETFDGAAPVPGKRTLTEQLPPLPVQRTPASLTPTEHVVQRLSEGLDGAPKVVPIATGYGDLVALAHEAQVQRSANSPVPEDGAIHEAAASGIANNAARLPYHDQIQALFGRHDISGVQAHVSGDAATASRTIGAEAYATGNHVAFATSPSLHTAAHEAAHVVQQRGGVQLKGGVGEAGDQYERHADQVADAVVRGESAEGLLDQYAGGRGVATKPIQRAVQREPAKDVNSRSYFDEHEHEIAATAADQLETFPFATGDPAAKWASGGNRKFAKTLAAQIRGGDARLKEIVLPETVGVINAQSNQVNQTAAQKGVSDPANVYYFIYKENKSYGMLAMAHREMTGTKPDHYINGPAELRSNPLPDSKVLVILDDVAGSGQSLSSAYTQAREAGFKGEIIISPMVSTHDAPNTVQHGFGHPGSHPDNYGQPADAKTTFAPKAYANALADSAWFKSLPDIKQERLRYLVEGMGYGDNALSMVFPYMSPDNNNNFFAGTMADQFIVNQNTDAAKNKTAYTGSNK